MSVELLQNLSMIFYIAAAVLLLVAVALFFLLDIKRVVGDVSGSTARKAIETIRQQNEESGNKAYRSSPFNVARGKITDKISPSGRLARHSGTLEVSVGTSELASDIENPSEAGQSVQETTVLNESGNLEPSSDTTILSYKNPGEFTVDYEIEFCESSEIIQ